MNPDGVRLLQRIVQSPEPPPSGIVVVLSAHDEPHEEAAARWEKANHLGGGRLFCRPNTYEEALAAQRTYGEHVPDLIIVTSAYHQLRAFLTFVKVFEGTTVKLWNAPAPSAWDKLEEELRKIEEYQAKRHVASYAEGLAHLAWRDAYNCAGAA